MGSGRRRAALAAIAAALVLPAAALAAFPGGNPAESPRANTPNDPEFDRCEPDDTDTPGLDCTTYWNEDYRLFGFSPETANQLPDPLDLLPRSLKATKYANCAQLDAQGRAANVAAGDPQCAQISGIRADTAWKYSTGDPDVVVAILDTGIRWQEEELVNRVHLNHLELPTPQQAGGTPCPGGDDCNGDGAFNVFDFAADPRVDDDAGDEEADAILDGSDLIATFSDGTDADGNGFVDDIAGWDFFDDDNDPFDASSCCSANGHGTGRAREALAETDNGVASPGICPDCQLMPLRIWDTFVAPGDFYAMGVMYAARNGASVVEGAVGGLTNTRFARRAFDYADKQGLALTLVSSDINSANHNYPTNYNEAIYVGGSLPDSAPLETCSGPGGLPGIGDILNPPPEFEAGCQELLGLLDEFLGINPTLQPITTSFFRNSNVTQYGGKADIVLMGSTGSENTGQASGAAGLLASFGREKFGDSDPLSGNEIRQLLTMTAEDVLPANTGIVGLPDKARPGWDTHFGYGRVNLAAAMKRIASDRVPPEAEISSPDWFAPINIDTVPAAGLEVTGHAAAPHGAGVGSWALEYACGQDAADSAFQPVPGASGSGAVDGILGTLPRGLLEQLANSCDGSVSGDAGRPAGALGDPWPADPYPDPDPERHAFQLRLTVHEAGDPGNIGRYRKTLHAYRNDGNLAGWPRPVGTGSDAAARVTGSGGEVPPRLYDLDGDNDLEVLLGTSSGELHALRADGSPLPSWNGGAPVTTDPYRMALAHPPPAGVPIARESLRTPAVGDIDGDREPEVVAAAGEHVYAWERDGERVTGFPVRTDPARSDPCVPGAPHPCLDTDDRAITSENHIKRGIFGSPALADLDGDGRLDIVTGSMDAHVYAWDGDGHPLSGFPVKLSSEGADGAEIITSPAIAQLDGSGPPEVVIATNEVLPGDPDFPSSIFDLINAVLESTTGSNPVYALHGDGTPVDGSWPVQVGIALGDVLPLVVPGHDAAVLDEDGDGDDEVSLTGGTGIGGRLVDGDGSTISAYANALANTLDQGPVINLADYPTIGDLSGAGNPVVLKGGVTVNFAVNLAAPNQNLPFSHVVQAWNPGTGVAVPGYPRATDDFQLLSQPVVARVAGGGPARQAIVGTGLYQLHAYGPAGGEASGWPKFTGGWVYATPAVGDADGDGDLDVGTLTREGWAFLWNTGVPACDGSNSEWWTFHHDEHGTANYGHDARPPGTARGLTAARDAGGAVTLSWRAPGDDWLCETADRFRVLVSEQPIEHPADGATALVQDEVAASGEQQSVTVPEADLGDARHAAVLHRDEAGNWGLLRSIPLPPRGAVGSCHNRITGTARSERLIGTGASDEIRGRRGHDRIRGRGDHDCLYAGRGRDRVKGGSGDDFIRARGRGLDRVTCGAGDDTVIAGIRDRVGRSCENVSRV